MTDWYGKGRWGTGDRPMQTGPEQSAYDSGAQQWRFEEERRLREQREHQERARKKQEEWRRKDRERAQQFTNRTSSTPSDQQEDDIDFDGWMLLAGIAGLTFLLVQLWGFATASLSPTNAILAAIVDHGVWGVGLLGIGLGVRFHRIIVPIAKIILGLAVLFFGSAIAVGIYRAMTG